VSVSAGLILTVPADAQQRFQGSSGVVIDLSVLDGGGGRLPTGPGGQLVPNTSGGFVQFPPAQKPVSRLDGPLINRSLTLTSPTSRTSLPTSRTASAAPVVAPTPAVAPKPPVVQKPAPVAAAPASPPAPKPTPAPAAATPTVTPPPAPPAPTATAAAETPPPPPVPTQSASRPSTSAGSKEETRILFDAGSANLNDAAKSELDALATQLKSDTAIRVQLQAYAAGTDETAPDARRLSLSRALKVRSHLIDQGVRSTRMDVRALGVKAEGGPADRVDAVVVRR